MSYRDYVFTSWIKPDFEREHCRYICWGREMCPTTNREHFQGFIILNRTARLPGAKKIIRGGDSVHLESRRGTRVEARDYCRKDGEFFEWGEFESMTQKELFKCDLGFLMKEYPAFFCRFHRGLALLRSAETPNWRDVEVCIVWGSTGSGKTRSVMEIGGNNPPTVYKLDPPYTWWDGYWGEDILLIDDYESGAIPRGKLLNICDGYKLRLETKGGHAWANWTKVYITSNINPELWTDAALMRRVTCVSATG